MLWHIWVNLQIRRLVIGSHFQQLYHLLVSALTSSQVPNGQVNHLISCLKLVMQHGETQSHIIINAYYVLFSHFILAAATSGRQEYMPESRQNDTIKVGPGNLKLIYSGNEGKLTQYINSKSLVCYLPPLTLMECWNYRSFYKFHLPNSLILHVC